MDAQNVAPAIGQVAMDSPDDVPVINSVPPIGQDTMAARMVGVPPLGQNPMVGVPPLSQNAMAAQMVEIPPLSQNTMATPMGILPLSQNLMACLMGVPSLGSAPTAMMNSSNANGKKAVNYPKASKINMKPVHEAKQKGSCHCCNVSLPAKLTCSHLQAEKVDVSEGEEKPIWAVLIEVANCYPLMSYLTDLPYPFKPFRFYGQKQLWYCKQVPSCLV
eukprot:812991-Rhodomonas_salina.2